MDLRELQAGAHHAGTRHPWERARLRIVSRLLANYTAPPSVVVDIGCGDGFVVGELARRYPAAAFAAVDPALDDSHEALLRERFAGHTVTICRTLDEAAPLGRADVILLLDVLEHIQDDLTFLEQLRRSPLVGPDTLLVITVPAYQRLFGPHDAFLHHARRYDPPILIHRLDATGFRVLHAGEFFIGPLLARSVQVWLASRGARRDSPESGLGAWRGGRLLTAALTQLLWLDFASGAALRKRGVHLPGLSAYALCRPSAS